MLTTKTIIVNQLLTLNLPVLYELFVDSNTQLPAITYIETNNYDYMVGSTIGYSQVVYRVKLWANAVSDIETYSPQIDAKMRELGFTRTYSNELATDSQICKILDYTDLGLENLN